MARRQGASDVDLNDLYQCVLRCVLFPVLSQDNRVQASSQNIMVSKSKVHDDTVLLSPQALNDFKLTVKMQSEVFRGIPNALSQSFAHACDKLAIFQQLPADLKLLITLIGGCIKGALPPGLTEKAHDELLFQVMERFSVIISGAIQKEGAWKECKDAALLSLEVQKRHLGSFVEHIRNLRNVYLTGSRLSRWVQVLFGKAKTEHEQVAFKVQQSTNEKIAYGALSRMQQLILADRAPGYRPEEFITRSDYDMWKMTESKNLGGLLQIAVLKNPKLKSVQLSDSFDPIAEFIPQHGDVESYYKALLRLTFQHEIAQLSDEETLKLSPNTKAILAECGLRWGLTRQFRKIAFLEILVADYKDGRTHLQDVYKTALKPVQESIQLMGIPRNKDLRYYLRVLNSLHDCLLDNLRHLFDNVLPLETANPNDPQSPGEKFKYIGFVLQRISDDSRWKSFANENISARMRTAIEHSLNERYKKISDKLSQIPRELPRMQGLVKQINREILKCEFHFSEPLLGDENSPSEDIVSVKLIAAQFYVDSFKKLMIKFAKDLEEKYRRHEDEDYEISEMLDLYKLVRILYDRIEQFDLPAELKEFDVENWFAPFVQRWLDSTDQKWLLWVESAVKVEKDQGHKPTLPPKYMYSSSVVDLFSSFHAGLDFFENLRFRDINERKELLTKNFIMMIQRSLSKYAQLMLEDFETIREDENCKEFSSVSCMKMNNIIGACEKVEEIFDKLSIARNGKIDEELPTIDEIEGEINFDIKIINAIDLQICDWNSSDPYVQIIFKGRVIETTPTRYKTLNPVWNFATGITLSNKIPNNEAFIRFRIMDEDTIGSDDLCGESEMINLRDRSYRNCLKKDEKFELTPQGTLFVRMTRAGKIDDPDFYVQKAAESVETALEDMLHIYMEKMIDYLQKIIQTIVKKVTGSQNVFEEFFSFGKRLLLQSEKKKSEKPDHITDTHIEELLEPVLEYLDTNLGLFNETLDPRVGEFIDSHPSLLGRSPLVEQKRNKKELFLKKSSGAESSEKKDDETANYDEEKPNSIIKLLWRRIVIHMYQEVSSYGGGGDSNKKSRNEKRKKIERSGSAVSLKSADANTNLENVKIGARYASLPSNYLTEEEKNAIVVLDIILEYLKSFFYCEVDGVHHGFTIEELETEEYLKLRNLILSFNIK
ncbi:hypothetical protein HK098_007857 [Nowakowskiella sp. JEL0407]|nr:hypothetical protein HK098_007857 [Nowakowskiella sp. JEL0407]